MFSPFVWRHALLLLLPGARLAASLWFAAARAAGTVPRRILTLIWAALSFAAFLFTATLISRLEPSPSWRATHKWNQVRPGMTEAQVVALLGPPAEIAEEFHFYDLHPNEKPEGYLRIEGGVVKEIAPPGAASWGSEAMWTLVEEHRVFWGMMAGLAGIPILLGLSLLPFGLSKRWLSLPLYYPLFALLCAFAYESVPQPGWRFDQIFFFPAYGVIAATWILRVLLVYRRPVS